jgi:uncharacterized damage-inducible protein DinB
VIDAGYVRLMARYNTWQNKQLADILQAVDDADAKADQGAFFGSIHATLNHLLWADQIWMSRFDPSVDAPGASIPDSVDVTPSLAVWEGARSVLDGKIRYWAQSLSNLDLTEHLTWYSGAAGTTMSKPLALCVMHFFNHQTHHRGQVHAMLTAQGQKAPVSDLAFLPEN